MLLRPVRVWTLLFLCLSPAIAQQPTTIWTTTGGDWFKRSNWSEGVPNVQLSATIPSGKVTVESSLTNPPSVRDLVVGAGFVGATESSLIVDGTFLDVAGSLGVGQSVGANVTAELTTNTGRAASTGDVVVLGDVSIGSQSSGFFRAGATSATANIGGSLRIRDGGSQPELSVGRLSSGSSVKATLDVGFDIGTSRSGYGNVVVGHIFDGVEGNADAVLSVRNLFGSPRSTMQVGVNDGNGNLNGHVAVRGDVTGFRTLQLGTGGGSGSTFASLEIDGTLGVTDVEVGSKSGNATGLLQFNLGSAFKGSQITVFDGSELIAPSFLSGNLSNFGTMKIRDAVRNEQGIVEVEGDFFQSSSGVTEFDVRSFEPGIGHELMIVGADAELSGRMDVRFANDFQADSGKLTLLQAGQVVGSPAIRLINPPKGLAVFPTFGDGFVLELGEPEPLEFLNPNRDVIGWSDPENWRGNQPETYHQVDLFNSQSFPQTVIAKEGGSAHRLTLGGKTAMILSIPRDQTFVATHELTVDRGGALLLDNANIITSDLTLRPGGDFIGSGNLFGNLSNSGRVQIGDGKSTETLTIDGNFTQAANGNLEIDILGGAVGQFDQLIVEGQGNVGGNLLINLPDDFELGPGLTLPIFTATDGLFGDFDIHLLGDEFQDLEFQFTSDGDTVFMTTSLALNSDLGDLNDDGVRDDTDVLAFSRALTDMADYINSDLSKGIHPLHRGDLNFDNFLDLDDIEPFLVCVRDGICLPEFELVEEVPEPSTGMLGLLTGAFVILVYRSRARRRNDRCN